jgi:hypothetical protein
MAAGFLWFIIAFLCGSVPFSVWVGRLAGKNIRQYGDGNPGATNAWKAGGAFWGGAAAILDFAKGAIPVLLANYVVGLEGYSLAAVALAPLLGHAYSPFLRFRFKNYRRIIKPELFRMHLSIKTIGHRSVGVAPGYHFKHGFVIRDRDKRDFQPKTRTEPDKGFLLN